MRVEAPGKINFGLRVVGRRPDGYHELDSVFLPLELADRLEIELCARPGVSLAVEAAPGEEVPADPGNLAWRAAEAFLAAAGLHEGVGLRLTKRIPAAAGLGGGSSDAAATLLALAELHPGRVDAATLERLALGLGADVPWFLDPRPARVGGIGDERTPLDGVPRLELVLAKPAQGLATGAVYAAYDAAGPSLTPPQAGPSFATLAVPWGKEGRLEGHALAPFLVNDLEPAATRLCPAIARLRERLADSGARAVGMSGSGPTVFGIFDDPRQAREAERGLEGRLEAGTRTWVTATRPAPRPDGR